MRLTIIIFFSFCILLLRAGTSDYYSLNFCLPPDSIPPPPPNLADSLSGPAYACIGETSEYAVDVPVACICQWSVNGILQPESGSPFNISWSQPGLQIISVVFYCAGGQQSTPKTTSTIVYEIPQPGPISGDALVCEYTYHTYSTITGPYDSCEWTVNGIVQPGYAPELTYEFSDAGVYQFEVTAYNPCGTGNPTFKNVQVLNQPEVFLGNDTTIMQGQTLILDAGNPGSEYLWSTSETTQTISVNNSGIYTVNVSNFCGMDDDTIEVSVVVGLNESPDPSDCFDIIVNQRKIQFTKLQPKALKIQVINLSGVICYEGPAAGCIAVACPGIYCIRVIFSESSCYKKVFIP